jgi:asparagine synthase (glutamine-hydrolysing)
MPGIVGLITKLPRELAEPQLSRMVKTLQHESFYTLGTWIDESLGIYVGWVARKGSFSDGMPLRSADGEVVLIFSGEDFSQTTAVDDYKPAAGLVNTSYLAEAYKEDPAFPAGLNGRFHGLLVDRAAGTAMLFNDRYGMHRLYYHQAREAFYFSAEAKAVLEVRPELRTLDLRGLAETIACGCVLENRTLFQGVQVLPQAASWTFRNASIERESVYFQTKQWEDQPALEPESYYQEMRRAFSHSLPKYFGGPESIGMSLTGGLDTRLIMAWRKADPNSLPCYTFGGMYRDCQDVVLARRIAGLYQQPHTVLEVGEDFLANFPRYAERSIFLTDGCVDVSRAPDLYVQERARQIAPVRIAGTYGSEIIAHSVMFKAKEPEPGLFSHEMLPHIHEAVATYNGYRREHPATFAAFRQSPWYHYGVLALEQTQVAIRTPYLDNEIVRTVFRAPNLTAESSDVRRRLIREGDPILGEMRTDRGVGGGQLSRAFQEFTFKAEYAYDYGMPQAVARIDHFLSIVHPERLFLGRHKFYHFRIWYRDALSNYVREMLLDQRSLARPYIDRKRVEAIVRGHLSGQHNYTTEIHRLLSLELVHRLFLDAK